MEKQMTPAEEVIMQCLWESGEDLTVYEITERLREHYGKDYANNAVATFMKNLLNRVIKSITPISGIRRSIWMITGIRSFTAFGSSGTGGPASACWLPLWKPLTLQKKM